MQQDTIIRYNPQIKKTINYPHRYSKKILEQYRNKLQDDTFQKNYKLWKEGTNHRTKRKLKIGGITHEKIGKDFYIDGYDYTKILNIIGNDDEQIDEYIDETNKIKNDIDNKNNIIKQDNEEIHSVVNKINQLKNWNDFIEYDNNKYGLHEIMNNIHKKNNCNGTMTNIHSEFKMCNKCDNGMYFCGRNCTEIIITYKCNKCDYVTTY